VTDPPPTEPRQRGPFYALIAAFFVPFLAVLFPYLVLDDYRRTRALVASGAQGVKDPSRAPRQRDGLFWAAGALWLATLLAIPAARATGANSITAALLVAHLVSASFSALMLITGWLRSDRRTPEEKQAEFAVREAQLVAFFDQRDQARSGAGVGFSEPPVPWVSRGVWRRWFLVRWAPETDGFDPATLGLGPNERSAAAHATPVTASELEEAPVADVVGEWAPRRADGWTPAPAPRETSLEEAQGAVTEQTPSPFRFVGMSWPVCHGRLAVLVWEGNVGLPPDGIGLPMGVPDTVEQLVRRLQGTAAWDTPRGWDGNAVFQCSACGRLYGRAFEV
jgi:hypothetical protein